MISEFANSDDIQDHIDMCNLIKVEFDEHYCQHRIAKLFFDDDTYITLTLENCFKHKIWKWTWYVGCMIVKKFGYSSPNYEIKVKDNALRNLLIDGIEAEEKRLENCLSEQFTNVVRDTNDTKYSHNTIFNGVEFMKNNQLNDLV